MYVSDAEGNVSLVDPNKYDNTKHFALTNKQLMGLRERAGNFAMNSEILTNLSGTTGMKSIRDFLMTAIEKLGTTEVKGYSSKEANDIFNGAKILMESGPDGFYKITEEKQAKDVAAALKYLKNQLRHDPGMWNTLEATIAANNGNPHTDIDKMIAQMIYNNTDRTLDANFDSTTTKFALEQSGHDKTQLVEDTYLSRIAHGQGE